VGSSHGMHVIIVRTKDHRSDIEQRNPERPTIVSSCVRRVPFKFHKPQGTRTGNTTVLAGLLERKAWRISACAFFEDQHAVLKELNLECNVFEDEGISFLYLLRYYITV
jgi:hypothetical protein